MRMYKPSAHLQWQSDGHQLIYSSVLRSGHVLSSLVSPPEAHDSYKRQTLLFINSPVQVLYWKQKYTWIYWQVEGPRPLYCRRWLHLVEILK